MDPLGVTAPIVDALSLPRWSSTPVPAYENAVQPASSIRTQNPFPVRRDLNSKVALWWVFIGVYLRVPVRCFISGKDMPVQRHVVVFLKMSMCMQQSSISPQLGPLVSSEKFQKSITPLQKLLVVQILFKVSLISWLIQYSTDRKSGCLEN